MGFKILADEAQYDYAKAILAPNKDVQAVVTDSPAGTGKALTNDSLVQTPNGPIEIGKIKIGDQVFGVDGKPCNVVGVFPQGKKKVWKVTFSDGNTISCCEEHLWSYQTKDDQDNKKETYRVNSLKEIHENIPLKKESEKGTEDNIYIPMAKAVSYQEKKFMLSPYEVGTLLKNISIPEQHLYGSVEQRLSLLQGLIDSNGSVNGSIYVYTTQSKNLANDIQLLSESLGLTCSIIKIENRCPALQKETDSLTYGLRITPSEEFPKLHTSEEHEKDWKKSKDIAQRTIVKIEPTEEEAEMTCITVDGPESLYLTEHYIVTHNTAISLAAAYYQLSKGTISKIIYVRNTVSVRENGFLPGTIEDKESAYMKPAYDVIQKIGLKLNNQDLFEQLIADEQLVCTSTSFLRGVDYDMDAILIIDEAQNLDLTELQTVLTRPHDNVKVVMIGSSLQNDNAKIRKFGPEKLLPFQVYIKHFAEQSEIPIKHINLTTNYRGRFANFSDQIQQTVKKISNENRDASATQVSNNNKPLLTKEEENESEWFQSEPKIDNIPFYGLESF